MSMTRRPSLLVLLALLALGACSAPDEAEPTPAPQDAPTQPPAAEDAPGPADLRVPPPPGELVDEPAQAAHAVTLEGGGLRLVGPSGTTRALPFGTAVAAVEEALTGALGAPIRSGVQSECGVGPLDYRVWPGGLTTNAQDGALVGWNGAADLARSFTTMTGVTIGSTRAELEAAYAVEVRETSLGQEFSAGELHGLLNGTGSDAQVLHLWSGSICAFR